MSQHCLVNLSVYQVELSLGFGIFVGCCMVAGSLASGFREMLAVYIVSALADESHVFVITFILFMAGLVGLIEKAGGLEGITIALQKFVKTTRTAQGALPSSIMFRCMACQHSILLFVSIFS